MFTHRHLHAQTRRSARTDKPLAPRFPTMAENPDTRPSKGDKHDIRRQAFCSQKPGRGHGPGGSVRPGPGPGSAQVHPYRLGNCQDRRQRGRYLRDHGAQLQALGQGDQRRRRHHAQGLQQARAHRGHRIRRSLQHRGGRARHRAPDHPGQGRLRAAALGHGLQPGRGADLRKAQISAAGRHLGDRQGPRSGQALEACLLLPGHGRRICRGPGRHAGKGQEGRQDQQQSSP